MIGYSIIESLIEKGWDKDRVKDRMSKMMTGKVSCRNVSLAAGASEDLARRMMLNISLSEVLRRIDQMPDKVKAVCTRDAAGCGCHVPDSYEREVKYQYDDSGDVVIVSVSDVDQRGEL